MIDLHHVLPIAPTDPMGPGGSFVDFQGNSVSGTISGITAHTWIDDANGLFHTTSDLNAEWTGYYQQMITGHAGSLSPTQRLEAQAESVFLHTGLSQLGTAQQAVIREDVQREIDAIGAALHMNQVTYGTNPNSPFTEQSYYQLAQTIQANPQLEELAVQGHGLNNPVLPRYDGYTGDAQNNIDNTTVYVGPGTDHGEKAVADFMDDAIMTHLPFPIVSHNGQLVQLNQNGQKEQTLKDAVLDTNLVIYGKLLSASDFSS